MLCMKYTSLPFNNLYFYFTAVYIYVVDWDEDMKGHLIRKSKGYVNDILRLDFLRNLTSN